MDPSNSHPPGLLQKLRFITQLLVISGALNIGLLATFFYQGVREKDPIYSFSAKPKRGKVAQNQLTNQKYLSTISSYSFRELTAILSDDTLLEQGYRKRDFALSVLVQFHYFNLEKALSYRSLSQRMFSCEKEEKTFEIAVFPGLSELEYDAIIHFAVTEKWPLTAEGIFRLLKKNTRSRDPSLEHAFCVTKEFHILETLFYQTGMELPSSRLAQLAIECDWQFFQDFCLKQAQAQDLSVAKRRELLREALEKGSPEAASIILQTDLLYVTQKLDDALILQILDLSQKKTEDAMHFCAELLKSPRSDLVWKKGAEKLYFFHGEIPPEPFDCQEALVRFTDFDGSSKTKRTELEEIAWNRPQDQGLFHIVKEGETLWKIARTYHVELGELIRVNALDGDQIQPGSQLMIP